MLEDFMKRNSDYFYFVFRVVVGIVIALHGAQKWGISSDMTPAGFAVAMKLPVFIGYLVASTELIGGILIALGLLTRLAAIADAIVVLYAYLFVHLPTGWNPLVNGGEKALLLFVAFLVILVYGAKSWGVEKTFVGKEAF
jgi:putative oxidoreductase